jgi:uncharacterized membrane protein SpoIIM required for sporulation
MSETSKRKAVKMSEGRRWYDSVRVIWALFGVIGMFVVAWGGVVYSMAKASELENARQDEQIKSVKEGIDKIDRKVDKVLDKLAK